jgi:hypothetical protein
MLAAAQQEGQRESNSNPSPVHGQSKQGLTSSHNGAPTLTDAEKLAELELKVQILQNDLDTAIYMLADWCVAVDERGTGWDDWDEYYKDAMYRDGPLRKLLDVQIAALRAKDKQP